MDPWYWGIVVVIVVGILVVAYGVLADRQATKRKVEAMTAPPRRDIPKFAPDSPAPAYLTELQARTPPAGAGPSRLDAETRHFLTEALANAPAFPNGYPRRGFLTDATTGWAVATDPMVLVCAEEIPTIRELLPVMELAQGAGQPLVIVAPEIPDEVIDTLAANTVQGKLLCLPILLGDPEMLTAIAELTQAEPTTHADLQAGYLPEASLGRCLHWVCDEDTSWVITE